MFDRILNCYRIGYYCIRPALSIGLIGAVLAISGCVGLDFEIQKNIYIGFKSEFDNKAFMI